MERVREVSQQVEQALNQIASPIKPYLAHIGRFLLVVTFFEDALRIFWQWNDQVRFMEYYRSFPRLLAHCFLLFNFTLMLVGSSMSLVRFKTPVACSLLASVVVAQTLGYGLVTHMTFMLRNLSLIGGILLLLAEHYQSSKKTARTMVFPGLPDITEVERGTYASLLGRILLIFLFGALAFTSDSSFTIGRILFGFLALISSVMVAVGFKARYSALFLVAILCIFNIFINQWWNHRPGSAEHDFLRYDFFQMLSIMGGFLLLANTGPGELSIDEKKKSF